MNETIINRLAQMRALMSEGGVQAVIVPQADPHQGEYLAPHWQVRRWLSASRALGRRPCRYIRQSRSLDRLSLFYSGCRPA